MQVLLHADANTDGRQAMSDYLQSVVTEALGHHGDRITRVEAHLSDSSGSAKTHADDEIHCTLEARLIGLASVVVAERARTAHQAIHGAVRKLESAVEGTIEKHDPRHKARLTDADRESDGV